ncbi:MAG: hypothetical protein ACTHJ5_15130 [Ilyomonas sp.]
MYNKDEKGIYNLILNDLKMLNEKYKKDISAHYHFTLQPLNLYFRNNPSRNLQKDIISVFSKYLAR